MNVQEETAAAATDVSTPKEIFTAHVRKVSSCRTTKEYVVVSFHIKKCLRGFFCLSA